MKKKFLSFVMVFAVMFSAIVLPPKASIQTYAIDYGSNELENYAYKVAEIVNKERTAYGLEPLKYSEKLSEPAIVRAVEIQSVFSHTRPNGTSCFTAVEEAGIRYSYVGENIAYGQRTPEEVMNAWMNSSGHRANILNQNFEYIGIGVAYKNGIYYWTQFFATSNNLTGEVITSSDSVQETTIMEEPETTTIITTNQIQTETTLTSTKSTEIVTPETITVPSENNNCNLNSQLEIIKKFLERFGIDLSRYNQRV